MSQRRTVVRRYWSKRKNEWVTKTYTYAHKSKRGLVLVDKRGRVVSKNVERFRESIINNASYDEATKRVLLADLGATIQQRKYDRKKLTTSGFMGKQEEDQITRFLTNAGYSPDEFAEELGVDIDEIMDTSNWTDGMLIIGGRKWRFNWTYTGNFAEEII